MIIWQAICFPAFRVLFLRCPTNLINPSLLFLPVGRIAISRAVEKSSTAKIESVALSETYSPVTRLKVSKVRSERDEPPGSRLPSLPVGINPGTLGDTVTSGSRLALPQSNLDRSTMHKWSNDPRAVHKLVTYSVTTLSGTLGAIPLRVAAHVSPRPLYLCRVLFSTPLSSPKREMYRAVTFPPLNPSEWAVPPWRTYRTNFAPVHDTARSLKGMKAVSIYVQPTLSVQLSRFIYRVARAELVSHSTIPYGPSHELLLVVDSRRRGRGRERSRKYGTLWRIILMIALEHPIFV